METESLREKATRGILWSFTDQFASQGVGFVIGIILARILTPSDYGLMGMLAIFVAVAQSFINSGFSSALIQKTNCTDQDFSTVFYFNLGVSIVLYSLLFALSPWIADFYRVPQLEPITKVVALNFVIGALSLVHRTKLMINVDFKTQTTISIISIAISGSTGIALAYNGFGVWALVYQGLVGAVSQTALFWLYTRWKPLFVFSKQSFVRLFGYGSKLLASNLIDTVYSNIYTIVIGKVFSASDLGYYTRAQQMESLPAANITGVLQRVTFPIFCSIQDDDARLIAAYRKLIRLAAYVMFPLMFLLVSIARPLVILLVTEKWLPAVDLFQMLCFAGMWYPIHAINLNILQAKGRSDLFLRLELWKKLLGTFVLVATIPLGLKILVLGQAFTSFACLFLNTYYTGKFFNYGIAKQLKDILVFLLSAVSICGITMFAVKSIDSHLAQAIAGVLLYCGIYFIVSKLFRFDELEEVLSIFMRPLKAAIPKLIP